MKFEFLIQAVLESDVYELYLTINERPAVFVGRSESKNSTPGIVRLDTKVINEEILLQFLGWAFPDEPGLTLPLPTVKTLTYSGRVIDVLSTASGLTIAPRVADG